MARATKKNKKDVLDTIKELGWKFEWESDPEGSDSLGDIDPNEVEDIQILALLDEHGHTLASLGGIVFVKGTSTRENQEYGRTLEREMAEEAITEAHQKHKVRGSTKKEESLFGMIVAAGVPHDRHESDLYIKDTTEARTILQRFPTHAKNATRFPNQREGGIWIDVPFAYDPHWNKKSR